MLTFCIKNSGAVFIIGEGFKKIDCKNNDKIISIYQNGQPGEQGVAGPAGPAGPKGDTGSDGAPGPVGEIGPVGPMGPKGDNGLNGSIGPQGVTGIQGDRGLTGPIGPQGVQGEPGVNGTNGVSGWELVMGTASADIEGQRTVTANCIDSKKVIGGGYNAFDRSNSSEVTILSNYPSDDHTWTVTGTIDGSTSGDESYSLQAYAICVNIF
jgi:hypothetical protein